MRRVINQCVTFEASTPTADLDFADVTNATGTNPTVASYIVIVPAAVTKTVPPPVATDTRSASKYPS